MILAKLSMPLACVTFVTIFKYNMDDRGFGDSDALQILGMHCQSSLARLVNVH